MKTEEALFSSVLDNSLHFNTLTSRLKFEFATPDKNLSSRAVLKMRNNDVISISIQPFLGIEAFKIELTEDSVKLIDRMNKRYISDSFENIKSHMPVDFNFNFNNLQALLSNSLFIPGKKDLTANEFKLFRCTNRAGKGMEYSIRDITGLIYSFMADGDERLRSTSVKDNSGENTLQWTYDNFQNVGNRRFPLKMTAGFQSNEKEMGTLTLSFSEPEINTPVSAADFKIPAGYERISFSQIIKSLETK